MSGGEVYGLQPEGRESEMERRLETSQRDAARTSPHDPEKTRLAPHTGAAPLFDDAAVQQARRAEPLRAEAPGRTRGARKSALSARFKPTQAGGKPVKVNGYIFYYFYFDKSTVGQWTPMTR